MRISPGRGVGEVLLGMPRTRVEHLLGRPRHDIEGPIAVYATDPLMRVDYSADGLVEMLQPGYGAAGAGQVFLGDVQLTFRLMDDVVSDLVRLGHDPVPSDIGFDFREGFAVFSMSSLSARDVDDSADDADERRVVEGVAVATWEHLGHLA